MGKTALANRALRHTCKFGRFANNVFDYVFSQTVKVLPNGYKLKETDYPTVDELINGFKKLHMGNGRTPQGPPGSGSRGRPPLGNMHSGLPPPPPAHLYPPPPAQMYGHHPPPPGHHGGHYPAPPPPPRAANPMATGPIPGVPVGGIPGYRR